MSVPPRTRLDEIIDEETLTPNKWESNFLKRIAERAFRHGVERTHSAYAQNVTWCRPMDTVQPGPAEEKNQPCAYCGHARKFHETCIPDRCMVYANSGCSCLKFQEHPDRRRGERRQGRRRTFAGSRWFEGIGAIWVGPNWRDAGYERRTGQYDRRSNDRRKK